MALRLADCYCKAGSNVEEALLRAGRYGLLMGQVQTYAPILRTAYPSTKLLEYLQPTYRDRWNLGLTRDLPGAPSNPAFLNIADPGVRVELARRCGEYVRQYQLDGLAADTPFEVAPGTDLAEVTKLMVEIANAISPAVLVPNFGDWGTYALDYPATKFTAGTLRFMLQWHFIQVAVDMSRTAPLDYWTQRVRTILEQQVKSKKQVIVGLHDPNGVWAVAAVALAFAANQYPGVWVYYQRASWPPLPVEQWQWNDYYPKLELRP